VDDEPVEAFGRALEQVLAAIRPGSQADPL